MVQTTCMSPRESQNHASWPKAFAPGAMYGFEIPEGSYFEAMMPQIKQSIYVLYTEIKQTKLI